MTDFSPRKAMLLGLLFCSITSAANAITSDPFLDPFDVVKTPQPEYALYEPPFWYAFWGGPVRPVVIYLHGAGANDETAYERMLTDMAHAGFVVVFPRYDGWSANQWYEDAKTKTTAALQDLRHGRVGYLAGILGYPPDTSRWALVGHSAGGMYSLKLANDASSNGLGPPTAVILHDAAGFRFLPYLQPFPADLRWLDRLDNINRDTLLVVLAAEETWLDEVDEAFDGDNIGLGNSNAAGVWSRAWHKTTRIDPGRKHAYVVPGGHFSVLGEPSAAYDSYERLTVSALRSAFDGTDFDRYHDGAQRVTLYLEYLFMPTPFVWF